MHLSDLETSLSYRITASEMPWINYVSGFRLWPVTASRTTFGVWTGDWDASPQDDLILIPRTETNVYQRGFAGVVCGHIHCAEIRQIGEITYYNDGDWVESCTALVEDLDGRLRIVRWAEEHARESASRVLSDYAPVQVAAE